MRLVAVTIVLLAGLATMPVAPAANECRSTEHCQTIVIPAQPPATQKATTYYLYAKGLTCTPDDGYCQGQPAPRVTAFVYEEANACGGLQRYNTDRDCDYVADRMVLL